jgi:hypothetical protein
MPGASISSFYRVRRALAEHRAVAVEGFITDYRTLGAGIHGQETFVVDGMQFAFNEFSVGPGYNKTRRSGGVLLTGSYVRIEAVDSCIARIELCEP